MCLVTTSRASCVQGSFQKDIRSSPDTAGSPACPGLPGSGFIAASLRPDDCVEPPGEPACCGWERRPHAWDSRGAASLRAPGRPWPFLCPGLSPFMPIKKKDLLQ